MFFFDPLPARVGDPSNVVGMELRNSDATIDALMFDRSLGIK